MINISAQEKFVSDLSNYIVSRVAGTHSDDEIVAEKPHRLYLVGTLAARKSTIPEEEKTDDGKAASIRASKLKASILVNKNKLQNGSEVVLRPTGNIYYKIKSSTKLEEAIDTDENTKKDIFKNLWKRISFCKEYKISLSTDSEFNIDFSSTQGKANKDPLIAKKIPDSLWDAKIAVKFSDFGDDN
ncbi:MAG: hypothetical protein ACFFG0_45695, partial [Candidatus Thorarchaeota archaeon]